MKKIGSIPAGLGRVGCAILAAMAIATGSTAAQAQCTGSAITFSGVAGDDTVALQTALQNATNRGVTLTISPGTYTINRVLTPDQNGKSTLDSGVRVKIRKSFTVNATGANFVVGDDMAGDVISIDTDAASFSTASCGGTAKANITWTGGSFDTRNMQVSRVIPRNLSTDRPTSSQLTGDALSFRGASTINNIRTQKLGSVTVSGISVTASDATWRTAGGDSGLFIGGASSAMVTSSTFRGTRDAGIYFSADDTTESIGGNYTARGITVIGSYDGITSKRGANNIVFDDNTITDTIIPLSIKRNVVGRIATNVTFTNNRLTRCNRCMLVERGGGTVTIDGNSLFEIGNQLTGETSVSFGAYEGVDLEGTDAATVNVRNNRFNAIGTSRAARITTRAIVRRSLDGIGSTAPTTSGNVFNGIWDQTNTTV